MAYAPPQLEREVVGRLGRHTAGVELLSFWTSEYVPHLRILNGASGRPEIAGLRDQTDAAFVHACDRTAADLILSLDKDLQAFGAAPSNPLRFLIDLRHYSRGRSIQASIAIGGSVFSVAAVTALVALVRNVFGLGRGLDRRYTWFTPLCMVSAAILVLNPTSRQWIFERIRRSIEVAGDFSTLAAEHVAPILGLGEAGRAAVRLVCPPHVRRLSDCAARVLAEAGRALSVTTIGERSLRMGYKPRTQSSLAYLRRVLRSDSRFRKVNRTSWELA